MDVFRTLVFQMFRLGTVSILLGAFILLCTVPSGCSSIRSSKKKEELAVPDKDEASRLVGDYAAPVLVSPIEIGGIGLVANLPNTGSVEPNSYERTQLYQELLRQNHPNPSALISNKTTAIVRIRAILPAGAQEGDILDAEVIIRPGSEVESLRGGYLIPTTLQDMASINGIAAKGFPVARVEGPILLSASGDTPKGTLEQTRGKILGGVTLQKNRELGLAIKKDKQMYSIVRRMEKAINDRFFIPERNNKGVATAKRPDYIALIVHPSYKNNVSRYLKIVQSIAVYDDVTTRAERIKRLERELLNPNTAQETSYQLEAIGRAAIPSLKKGLLSDNTEVRFFSAISLAYLNCVDAAAPLARIARDEPAFRVFALESLGTMKNDFEAESQLGTLLDESSAETRYGAFRALWTRNPNDIRIRGEFLHNQFYYHVIDTRGPQMIHIATTKRPEIVLFGQNITLPSHFSLEAGPKMIVKSTAPGEITVKKIDVELDETRTVSTRLDEVIRAMSELGGTYPDIMDFLKAANSQKLLSCRLEIDRIPQGGRVYSRNKEDGELLEYKDVTPEKRSFWSNMNPKNWWSSSSSSSSSDTNRQDFVHVEEEDNDDY